MSKISMVYLSNTGNTEEMADELKSAIEDAGQEVDMTPASEANAETLLEADILVLGCPACGDEELDEEYISPLMDELESQIQDKKIALFGTYGWGGGQYMEDWAERIKGSGAALIGTVVGEEGPSDVLDEVKELGRKIAAEA